MWNGSSLEDLKSDVYFIAIPILVKFTEAKFFLSRTQKSLEKILP